MGCGHWFPLILLRKKTSVRVFRWQILFQSPTFPPPCLTRTLPSQAKRVSGPALLQSLCLSPVARTVPRVQSQTLYCLKDDL